MLTLPIFAEQLQRWRQARVASTLADSLNCSMHMTYGHGPGYDEADFPLVGPAVNCGELGEGTGQSQLASPRPQQKTEERRGQAGNKLTSAFLSDLQKSPRSDCVRNPCAYMPFNKRCVPSQVIKDVYPGFLHTAEGTYSVWQAIWNYREGSRPECFFQCRSRRPAVFTFTNAGAIS